jgi:hypothetical protein
MTGSHKALKFFTENTHVYSLMNTLVPLPPLQYSSLLYSDFNTLVSTLQLLLQLVSKFQYSGLRFVFHGQHCSSISCTSLARWRLIPFFTKWIILLVLKVVASWDQAL